MALTKKEYNRLMNENWADLLFGKPYDKLNASGKKLVKIGIEGDKKHNDKDAKKVKSQNKELYEKGKKNGK